MLDASFIVFVGFVVFMVAALRFGYSKSLAVLDSKIAEIKSTLTQAEEKKNTALHELERNKKRQLEIDEEIVNLNQRIDSQINEINTATAAEIDKLLANRQHNFEVQIERVRSAAIDHLNASITEIATSTLANMISAMPEQTHQTINDQQLSALSTILDTSNGNNSSKKSLKKSAA